MDTLLITGGAGFIGSCLVRRLIRSQSVRVVNLDLLTYAGNLDSLAEVADDPLHTFVRGDIGDSSLLDQLLAQHQPTAILNLAAESHVDRSIDGPEAFVQTNTVGTQTLLEAALRYWTALGANAQSHFRFLQVSTDEVFGSLGSSGRFNEQSHYAPNSPYAASKAAADHFVNAYYRTYGLPTLITYSSNNYGPYQFPEKLFPLVTLNALEAKSIPVYGDGTQVRDWLSVEEHAKALQLVLQRGQVGGKYCIGANTERTNLDIVKSICDAVDRLAGAASRRRSQDLIQFVTDRPGHDQRYALDCSKMQTELHWKPSCDLAAGIEATVQWYIDNQPWLERIASGGYRRDQRLGLARFEA